MTRHVKNVYGAVLTRTLTNRDATLKAILKALGDISDKIEDRDTFIFYFAGHGLFDKDGGFYLATHDTDFGDLIGSAISGDQLKGKLARMKKGTRILILDACKSADIANIPSVDFKKILDPLNTGFAFACSCRSQQRAWEKSPEVKHGAFAYFFVKAPEGAGPRSPDGSVTFRDLDEYLSRNVKAYTKKELNENQSPYFSCPEYIDASELRITRVK